MMCSRGVDYMQLTLKQEKGEGELVVKSHLGRASERERERELRVTCGMSELKWWSKVVERAESVHVVAS
jgi:hypothetical protein